MKLSRALCLYVGLSVAACGDDDHKHLDQSDAGPGADGGADAAMGGGPTDGGGGEGGTITKQRGSRMVSVAPSYLVVGDSFNYTPKTSSKNSGLSMEGAPPGMSLEKGTVSWKPTPDQGGANYKVTLRATGAGMATGAVAEQQVNISVSKSTLRAKGTVDESGGQIYAQTPDAMKVHGMGAAVPPHALDKEAQLTMGALDTPPPTPNAEGQAVAATFGPHGTVFGLPAYLTLGLPEGVVYAAERLGVYFYDASGRWVRTPVLGVDIDNGFITAKAQHFSVYAAIQSALDFDVTLANTSANGACAGSLIGNAQVSSALSDIELSSVNNLSESLSALVASGNPSVQDVLTTPGFSGSLRAVQVFDLVEGYGDQEVLRDRKLSVTTLYVPGDGSATITHADALGNVIASKLFMQPLAELDEIASHLRGAASDVVFAGSAGQQLGLAARVHLSYFPGDASLDPVSVDDLGIAVVERGASYAPIAATTVADVDCDGVPDAFDMTDDSLMPVIDASPNAVIHAFTGDAVTLSARIVRGAAGVSGTWSLLDADGATLGEVANAPDARTFTATAGGRYLVSFKQTGGSLEHIFALDVSERASGGAAPTCSVSKQIEVGRVGDGVALTAVVADDDSPVGTLTVEWGLLDGNATTPTLTPASTIFARGDNKALFSPLAAGNYTIGCRAFDGMNYGAVGQVDLSIVDGETNRAPTDVFLSPMATSTTSGTVVTFHAFGRDPDGDHLVFNWQLGSGARLYNDPVTQGNESVALVQTTTQPSVKVTVFVTDTHGASVSSTATLLVGDIPTTGVDADSDGYSPGTGPLSDCNDNDPNVHPGATDHCGDDVDSDCDGQVNPPDCDNDGYTSQQGDCDDGNAKVYPGATELCDGVDNNCNQQTDEGYGVGSDCQQGTGSCVAGGSLRCSIDGQSSLCTAVPSQPMTELCDGVDNDCNGIIDDGNACPVDAGMPDAGMQPTDAGVPPFDSGTVVTAEAGVTGCVYSGPEICTDGIDNDCDSYVDAEDLDCQNQVIEDDACSAVTTIELNTDWKGTFDGAHYDFTSRCNANAQYVDLVYAFELLDDSVVSMIYTGSTPFEWSIQSGVCDDKQSGLTEMFCDADDSGKSQHSLPKGTYYLVLEGGKGEFTFQLQAKVQIKS